MFFYALGMTIPVSLSAFLEAWALHQLQAAVYVNCCLHPCANGHAFYPLWSIQLLTGVLCCSIWGAAFASCRFGALRDKRSDQSSKEGTPLLCFWTSFTFPFRSGSSCHHACGEGALRLGQCGEVLGEPAWAPNEEPIQVGTCFSRLHLAV